ncbi:hypothetical protein BBK82_40430 [Lentzea guizhouensis]|uniref:Double-GTPase 2 domain-containing protein n=2 Tax=Lentzea guizhouensis TaxID=1586287 RepID=A0A1B2I0E7_9PSEU|nr:hypothetical protein BBK82_40430 [Lentzea guizhouensis]
MIGLALALWVALWLFMFLLLPVLYVLMPVALVAGAVVGFVRYGTTLLGLGSAAPRLVTPDDVVAGRSLPAVKGPFSRDRAWPVYPAAQGWVDLVAASRSVGLVVKRVWAEVVRRTKAYGYWWAWVLVIATVFPVVAAFTAGAAAVVASLAALSTVVLVATDLVWGLVSALLRGLDSLVRRLRRATGSCPVCYHVTALPAFPCGGCGEVHRDLRPGRLGGVWRRCGCGASLPTTVLRAAHRIEPRCPRCAEPLRTGGAVITDIRLPVFGPVSAGKTRLVYAGLVALRDELASAGGELSFVDNDSSAVFADANAVITSGQDTVKTPAATLPHALTARLTRGRKRALLHLFDAAGEFYTDREDNSDLEFLDHAPGLVFVVDPFSVPWVRDQLGSHGAEQVARARPANAHPDAVYQVTARRLRDYGVETRRRNLAMTVVKADLLAGLAPGDGLRRGAVRDWLCEAGLDNLVLSAERDFGEVRYFVAASVPGHASGEDMRPSAPFRWLIGKSGASDLLPTGRTQEEKV